MSEIGATDGALFLPAAVPISSVKFSFRPDPTIFPMSPSADYRSRHLERCKADRE